MNARAAALAATAVTPRRPVGRSGRRILSGATTTPPAVLPPRATSDGTHRRILEGALAQFGARGYHGVSVRELAVAAGIGKSSVYAHISAKEDLLTELMLIGHEEHHDRLRDALLGSAPTPRDQLEALVRAHVEMHATYPLLARVANREFAALSPANAERVLRVRERSSDFLVNVVERGVDAGVFDVDDPWLAVAAIGAMGIRLAEWYSPDAGPSVGEVVAAYTTYALRILGAE